MTDYRQFSRQPDPAFADELERRLFGAVTTTSHVPHVSNEPEDLMTIELEDRVAGATGGSRRSCWMAAAAVVAVLAVGVALVATRSGGDDAPAAGPPAGSRSVDVSFDAVWPDLFESESKECFSEIPSDNRLAREGRCLRTFFGIASLEGDIEGASMWSMIAGTGMTRDGDKTVETAAPFNVTYLVDATIEGCGQGEFMIASVVPFVGWESGMFVGTWQIVPGSGRGELAAIGGGGTVEPQSDTDAVLVRPHTGTITC